MPRIIGGQTVLSKADVEEYIKKFGLGKARAQLFRLENQRKVFRLSRAEAQAQNPQLAQAAPGVSGLLNMLNTAGFGVPAAGAAALTSPITAAQRGISLGEAKELNQQQLELLLGASPGAQRIGRIAGATLPIGGAGLALRGVQAARGARAGKLAQGASRQGVDVAAKGRKAVRAGTGKGATRQVLERGGALGGSALLGALLQSLRGG